MYEEIEARKSKVTTISMEEFVIKASDTMTKFEEANPPEDIMETIELKNQMNNFAKFSAALAHAIFDGD